MSQTLSANCFSCKKIVEVTEPVKETTKNGRLRLKGKCSECSKQVSRFISDPDKPALTSEEKKAREAKRREDKKRERELNPTQLKSNIKKSKKRRIVLGDVEVTIIASEVTEDGVPKRRKLTAKEKREKEIRELKEKNEKLQEALKEIQETLGESSDEESDSQASGESDREESEENQTDSQEKSDQ
jgi:hypothetical protein